MVTLNDVLLGKIVEFKVISIADGSSAPKPSWSTAVWVGVKVIFSCEYVFAFTPVCLNLNVAFNYGFRDEIKSILNWSPKFSLQDGMEKTYEWISSNFLKRENNNKFTRKID